MPGVIPMLQVVAYKPTGVSLIAMVEVRQLCFVSGVSSFDSRELGTCLQPEKAPQGMCKQGYSKY